MILTEESNCVLSITKLSITLILGFSFILLQYHNVTGWDQYLEWVMMQKFVWFDSPAE